MELDSNLEPCGVHNNVIVRRFGYFFQVEVWLHWTFAGVAVSVHHSANYAASFHHIVLGC